MQRCKKWQSWAGQSAVHIARARVRSSRQFISRLLKYASQRRRRAMSIAPGRNVGASSVGAAPARNPVPMPLLRSFAVLVTGFYRHGAPTALGNLPRPRVFQQAVREPLNKPDGVHGTHGKTRKWGGIQRGVVANRSLLSVPSVCSVDKPKNGIEVHERHEKHERRGDYGRSWAHPRGALRGTRNPMFSCPFVSFVDSSSPDLG